MKQLISTLETHQGQERQRLKMCHMLKDSRPFQCNMVPGIESCNRMKTITGEQVQSE